MVEELFLHMRKVITGLLVIIVLVVGGVYIFGLRSGAPEKDEEKVKEVKNTVEPVVVFPIAEYASRITVNAFGEQSQVTLEGYHVGDDVEYTNTDREVSVFAIADGVLTRKEWIKGYGGVLVVTHTIEGKALSVIYGHVDLSSVSLNAGEKVLKGQQIAYLGEGGTPETDSERKHLHFAMYEGADSRIQGYEPSAEKLEEWVNPYDFFTQYGLETVSPARMYNPEMDFGRDEFSLEFLIPEGWEVQYDDSTRSLYLFTLRGDESARERSQILITYFDASQFLTLSTVTIHEILDLEVGQENYTAKRYDIEKLQGVASFRGQPSWRNKRHSAIDFKDKEGYTRYYSIAKNPQLDEETFQRVVNSIKITN